MGIEERVAPRTVRRRAGAGPTGCLLRIAWLAMAFCFSAQAQRLIVVTNTLSATHQSARMYVQSVDLDFGAPLPGPEPLPGTAPAGPMLLGCLVPSKTARGGGDADADQRPTYLSVFQPAPFKIEGTREFPSGWRYMPACTVTDPATGNAAAVMLGARTEDSEASPGRLEVYPIQTPRDLINSTISKRRELPGPPVGATALDRPGRVAVLCRGALGAGAVVVVLDALANGDPIAQHDIVDDSSLLGTSPGGLCMTGDGRHLLVLVSGYAGDRRSGEGASRLHALDAETLAEPCSPIEIPGVAQPEDIPLHPYDAALCWVATRSPESGFAYATCVEIARMTLTKRVQTPFTGVSAVLRLAPAPGGALVAVGVENRVEIWSGGQRSAVSTPFESTVAVLRWTQEGLFAAEAGRVHSLDPDECSLLKTVQLQSGWVTDLVLLSHDQLPSPDDDADGLANDEELALGTSPANPDSDGDGIPDGSDPEPAVPSPRLRVPFQIVFHGEAVGKEVKAFRIQAAHADNSAWNVTCDRLQMPWLVIHPVEGKGPGVVYLGVDPGRYAPGIPASGILTVHLAGTQPDFPAMGSPASFEVRIMPERHAGVRRILWLWEEGASPGSFRDPDDPHHLSDLADLLAAPPFLCAHHEAVAPFQESLDQYLVVVLNAQAAAQGALTRQALIDYVAQGGSLLFLGAYFPGQSNPDLAQWLNPLGLHIDTETKVDGVFPSAANRGPMRRTNALAIVNGCAVRAEDPAEILVPAGPDPHQAALVVSSHGRGRIAVLAAATPLENATLRRPEQRLFAEDLFQWLAEAKTDLEEQDMDGDGIPDKLEDRNSNGLVDPGETDYLNPDTDSDGIPDGIEDANLNGRVDEGETNPLDPDSNANGVLDGADPMPVAAPGSPYVAEVVAEANLPTGPAEGGAIAIVSGRNFAPDAVAWFGSRRAPTVRVLRATQMLAEVPPAENPSGGDVPVRVVNTSTRLEGVLPAGFRYTPRSQAHLSLQILRVEPLPTGPYEGTMTLRVETPPNVIPERVILLLHAEPAEGFHWKDAPPASNDDAARRPLVIRVTRAGDLYLIALGGKHGATPKDIGPISWEYEPEDTTQKLVLTIQQPHVTVHNGQDLDAVINTLEVNLQPLSTTAK